ncbi:MAG: tyrosine-type recombinase/integrase [archaeon]|nr:tyrosine-type recombinase/integrase [archaeon]
MINFEGISEKHIYIIKKYTQYLKEKGYAQETIKEINRKIKTMLGQINKPINQIITQDLKKYIKQKHDQEYELTTIAGMISVIRFFFVWLERESIILTNPSANIQRPALRKILPKGVLTENQIKILLEQPDITTESGKRDKAILELLYSTGIRKRELYNLNINDMDLSQRYLRINQGKGGFSRIVPIGKKAVEAIEEYLNTRQILYGEYPLFISTDWRNKGIYKKPRRMAYSQVGRIIRDYAKKTNMQVTIHTMRRTFATHMIKYGADIMTVKEMLGHRNIETLRYYVNLVCKDLKQEHSNGHPRG